MQLMFRNLIFEIRILRIMAGILMMCRAAVLGLMGRRYQAIADICWVARVPAVPALCKRAERAVFSYLKHAGQHGMNPIMHAFLADEASSALGRSFDVSGAGRRSFFRDVIVLKSATDAERGVVLVKYGHAFNAMAALFDVRRLVKRYRLVLEPSWAGYCDPGILMYMTPGEPMIIQCFTKEDRGFIDRAGHPFIPVELGPADWVDESVFAARRDDTKEYDLVMVANWSANKRHATLFRALRKLSGRKLRVLLVGFPWEGRTREDIEREASRYLPRDVALDIREKVPHSELALLLGRCRAFVFLSRKEGDNKALVEAMFCNVPAIVYDRSIGGARSRINAFTGVLASERELAAQIEYVLDHGEEFEPRAWAQANTGSTVSTRVLNDVLRNVALSCGESYSFGIVEKVNGPNLRYKHEVDRAGFKADYDYILSCRRDS